MALKKVPIEVNLSAVNSIWHQYAHVWWWCCCILTLLLTFILYFKDNLNDVTFALLFDRWLLQIQVQNKWDLFSIDCFISSRTVKAAACSILCWPGLLKAALENELYFEGCYNCGSIKKLLLFAVIVAAHVFETEDTLLTMTHKYHVWRHSSPLDSTK